MGTYVVVIGVPELVSITKGLVVGTSVSDIVCVRDSMGQLVEGGATTDFPGIDGSAAAERGGIDFIVEDATVVDICGCSDGISDNTTPASVERVRAAQGP